MQCAFGGLGRERPCRTVAFLFRLANRPLYAHGRFFTEICKIQHSSTRYTDRLQISEKNRNKNWDYAAYLLQEGKLHQLPEI